MRVRCRRLAAWASLGCACLIVEALRHGGAGTFFYREIFAGLYGLFAEPAGLSPVRQAIFELHLWRVLTVAGTGAALALSGALLQGVFQNALASPSIIGVSGGAGLGASIAIMVLGGYGPTGLFADALGRGPWFVSGAAFLGGLGAAALVFALSSSGGRFPVPLLLLTGLAVNAVIGGLVAVLHSLALEEWQVAQALFAWGFGHVDDKEPLHALTVFLGVALSAGAIPFVARELDLLAGGEDDAQALGVAVVRIRLFALCAATLAASLTVAVVGQIGFVGLIVPHMIRSVVGTSHRRVLSAAIPVGAAFLLSVEIVRWTWLREFALRPGALMSLIGGPAFIALLFMTRRSLRTW